MTEERILDFLDGNLDAHEEEELLHRLAVSPERRNLLKQHLQMRDLTSSLARRQFIPVPKTVTASLFTALAANGYSGPSMPVPTQSQEALVASMEQNIERAAQTVTRTPAFFRRSIIVAASLMSFIAGVAMVYFLMPNAQPQNLVAAVSATPNNTLSIPEKVVSQNNDQIVGNNRPYKSYTSHKTYTTSETYHPMPIEDNTSAALSNDNIAPQPILLVEAKSPLASAPLQVHGSSQVRQNPFDQIATIGDADRTVLQRFGFSVESGEGKAPGNSSALSGSLAEVRISYDVTDWFVAKVSIGYFMSYETQAIAVNPGFNADGIPLIQLSPISRSRPILGAEVGGKFKMFSTPFEADAGFIDDFQGNIIPRADFFTKLEINDNLDMNFGVEGMIYNHNILPSLLTAQQSYAGQHPSLIGQLQAKETTGFIGPSVEMVWHF